MTDAVTAVTEDTPTYVKIHMTCISDGTNESAVKKIDRSTLTGYEGVTVTNLNLMSARWAIQGFTSVRILWDHSVNDEKAMVLSGGGYEEFSTPLKDPNGDTDAITGTVGDVLLTSVGGISGSTYDITLTYGKN